MEEQEKNKEQERRRAERLEFQRRFYPYYDLGPNLFQEDEDLGLKKQAEEQEEQKQENPASEE